MGAEIRTLREQRGWSQTELARRAGMTQSAMARFEAGGTTPTLPVLERVAGALEMRLSIAFAPAWSSGLFRHRGGDRARRSPPRRRPACCGDPPD
ncbi:MAG TPA: helix-turn-helix transcriptional regulator [Pseudonocardiaceae bacterium]|nr:helix-turn-helix transcriptional regulator [Pseudonocardiaceae bacterium]